MSEQEIRDILAAHRIQASGIERNPATPGEWVVWYGGMGYPVYSAKGVQDLAESLGDES